MRVLDEEVFGPVCAVQSARDLDKALALANAGPYGLSASICTNDLHRALSFVERSAAGMVHVNRPTPGADPHMPFGGLRGSTASGWREQGGEAVRFFSEQQTVYVHHGVASAHSGLPAARDDLSAAQRGLTGLTAAS
jgi:aldehyde dehydrogenase (NAD+)